MKKRSNYAANETLQFSVFTESQCQEIHNATLEVMESVGAIFHDEEALALLKKAGAYVDGERVRFPAGLVEWAIRTAPSRIVLCDRNGGRKVFLEDHKTYFGPGPTNTYTLDPFTGEKRFPEISDSFLASKVLDALPNIDYQMDMGTPRNVPTEVSDIYLLEAMLTNSTKPIVHWGYSVKNYQTMVDMCVAIAGSLQELQKNPFLCLYSEPSSPFVHSPAAIQKAMFMARNNLPCIYTPAPSCGGTAPATLAGRSCENDEIGEYVFPADVAAGDVIAMRYTGAYTYSMASNYNRFGKPAVAFVRDGSHRRVVRAESDEDTSRSDLA